jgi:hypothetical protein
VGPADDRSHRAHEEGRVDGALPIVVGAALLLLGAVGATVTQRRFEDEGRTVRALPLLVPFGVLVGAGAALVRGWDLVASMAVGAVLVPVVGAAGRLWEVRRRGGRGAPRRRGTS